MRTPVRNSTKEEIKQKLLLLYSNPFDLERNVLDFDKKYDFFSTDVSLVLRYSSNWFKPEKYNFQTYSLHDVKYFQSVGQEDEGSQKCLPQLKQESLLKVDKPVVSTNLTRDLEVLGRTPYQIGVDGEKFRVVAATLQKCNSPFVRRTFHFTSNGIVEAPEKKNESENLSVIPFIKQTKTVVPPQKFVRIRRFRVIKKNDLAMEKYILPQKIKITNGEKTRFLTVRIRPENSSLITGENSGTGTKIAFPPSEMKKFLLTAKEPEVIENSASSAVQTEDSTDEIEQIYPAISEPDTSSATLDVKEEEKILKAEDVQQIKQGISEKEEKENSETFDCNTCGKHFPTYLSCLAHIRSHQRQVCQLCSKKFLTVKMLRDHIRVQHQHYGTTKTGTSEDRITTATSKFGRTRQVLNVAGLRSKYKML